MAKIQILGDAVVITSNVQAETLEKLAKYNPKALKLVDAESKKELFAVGQGCVPSASKFGIVFSGKNEEGNATATFGMPSGLTNDEKKALIQDEYGFALLNLNKIEGQINDNAAELSAAFATVQESIEILG